ncbi:MAG: type II toxin-antitoxin system RelE/ParE family toxin [Anaerolineales bacterium]|nr:type II toxin-antitoxin system RelE/ParE family toxin [Anaerolineales bacterium]
MPEIETSERFEASYEELPAEIRKKVLKAMRLLAENPRHPSLQTKPIQSFKGIYEARVDINYRMTYERLPNDVLVIRTVARHDETFKNP